MSNNTTNQKYCQVCDKTVRHYPQHIKTKSHQRLIEAVMIPYCEAMNEYFVRQFGAERTAMFIKWLTTEYKGNANIYDMPDGMLDGIPENIRKMQDEQ